MEGPFSFWPVQQSCKAALSQLELGPQLAPLGPQQAPLGHLHVSASQAPALSQNGTWAPVATARLWEEPTGRAWWREAWGRGNARKGTPGPIPPTAPEPALAQISRPFPNQLQFRLDVSTLLKIPFIPLPDRTLVPATALSTCTTALAPALSIIQPDVSLSQTPLKLSQPQA